MEGTQARTSPRRDLALTLLLGAVGAGLVFLATRQGWAQVRTVPPKPLPASVVAVTGAALIPFADALVVAGLASLAAVLATRGLLRRVTGGLLVALGIALGASAFTVSTSSAIAAADAGANPGSVGAGSVTQGTGPATSAVPNVAGAAPHVTFGALGWQFLVVLGALAMVVAGVIVIARAGRLAVMSSRYDAPAPVKAGTESMWEALSRGDDPTSVGGQVAEDH